VDSLLVERAEICQHYFSISGCAQGCLNHEWTRIGTNVRCSRNQSFNRGLRGLTRMRILKRYVEAHETHQ
jgi:hypothetical protein